MFQLVLIFVDLQVKGSTLEDFVTQAQDRQKNAYNKSMVAAFQSWAQQLQADQVSFESQRIMTEKESAKRRVKLIGQLEDVKLAISHHSLAERDQLTSEKPLVFILDPFKDDEDAAESKKGKKSKKKKSKSTMTLNSFGSGLRINKFKASTTFVTGYRPSVSATSVAHSDRHDVVPPRYGSSAEESRTPSDHEEKPKKSKTAKRKRNMGEDEEHIPLAGEKNDDDDDNESGELDGLDEILQLDGDGNTKKKPASKSKSTGTKKRPAAKKGCKRKDQLDSFDKCTHT
eukprot:Skav222046  [mRNA]  locus=scaffold1020:324341:331943:+ [translate_table: standard]